MRILADIGRITIILIALYVFFAAHKVLGMIIFGTALFSFIFKLRKGLFLEPSRRADGWELFGVALVLANTLIIGFGNYNDLRLSWLDIPMHLAGGAFAAWWAMLAFDEEKFAGLKNLIIPLGVAALLGVGWEFFEWIGDHTFLQWYTLPLAQLTLNDTMADLLFDLLGGLAVFFLNWEKKMG